MWLNTSPSITGILILSMFLAVFPTNSYILRYKYDLSSNYHSSVLSPWLPSVRYSQPFYYNLSLLLGVYWMVGKVQVIKTVL